MLQLGSIGSDRSGMRGDWVKENGLDSGQVGLGAQGV